MIVDIVIGEVTYWNPLSDSDTVMTNGKLDILNRTMPIPRQGYYQPEVRALSYRDYIALTVSFFSTLSFRNLVNLRNDDAWSLVARERWPLKDL